MKAALIDTDILSYFLRNDSQVRNKVEEYLVHHDTLIFSEISYFEILAGLEYKQANQQIKRFEPFALRSTILKLTQISLRASARIYGDLRRKGILIGTPDLLIAGLALENKLELVTNNEKHYRAIKSLSVKNWKLN